MRAAVFKAAGEALAIEQCATPEAGAGELVIAVRACGICGSDLHMADVHDVSGGMAPLPAGSIMGHEFCGEVVECGAGTSEHFTEGDRITALPYIGCGRCQMCLAGRGHRCRAVRNLGLGADGGAYADYVRVGAAEAVLLPPGVDWHMGALIEPLAVALRAVRKAALTPGDVVLIMGAGPIGLATALWCRYFGCHAVHVSDLVDDRLKLAEQFGVGVINAGSEAVAASVKKQSGRRPDVIFECIGIPGAQQLAMDYAPTDGRIVVVGVCMHTDSIQPVKAITKELSVHYVFCYERRDFELAVELIDRDRIDPSPLITRTVGFADFAPAFEALKHDKRACKVLLQPDAA